MKSEATIGKNHDLNTPSLLTIQRQAGHGGQNTTRGHCSSSMLRPPVLFLKGLRLSSSPSSPPPLPATSLYPPLHGHGWRLVFLHHFVVLLFSIPSPRPSVCRKCTRHLAAHTACYCRVADGVRPGSERGKGGQRGRKNATWKVNQGQHGRKLWLVEGRREGRGEEVWEIEQAIDLLPHTHFTFIHNLFSLTGEEARRKGGRRTWATTSGKQSWRLFWCVKKSGRGIRGKQAGRGGGKKGVREEGGGREGGRTERGKYDRLTYLTNFLKQTGGDGARGAPISRRRGRGAARHH